jgi:hypothetical protein
MGAAQIFWRCCTMGTPTGQAATGVCTAMMQDGRAFTDYRGSCTRVPVGAGRFQSAFEQRQFLMRNADALIEQERQSASRSAQCAACFPEGVYGTALPEAQVQVCDAQGCRVVETHRDGVGIVRGDQSARDAEGFERAGGGLRGYAIDDAFKLLGQ